MMSGISGQKPGKALVSLCTPPTEEPPINHELEAIADRLWEIRLKADPLDASVAGFHNHDSELQDLSDSGIEASVAALRAVAADCEALDPATLSPQERITRQLAIHQAETSATVTEGRYLVGSVDTFTGVATDLLVGVSNLTAADQSQSRAYAERWSQLPRLLDQVTQLNRGEIARGRAPARIVVERVVNMIEGYLATPLSEDTFVTSSLHSDCSDELRALMSEIAAESIRPAYAAYRDFINSEVIPASKPDERVGLTHNADGEAVYRDLIHLYTSITVDPQDLHEFGMAEATEKLPDEWSRIGSRSVGVSDLPPLFDRLRNDPELSYDTAQEMVRHAEATVERAWAAIDGWFAARPESPCDVVEVPPSIAADLPPAFYMTPSSDGSRPGRYYLNTHEPSSRKRFNYESIHFHEAIPGHHFDRSLSMELKGIPEFRKRFPSFAMAEGWGLYAERLADEMGLYSSDMDRLGMLTADAWRAGRLVVDTGMHAFGWTRQRAIDWLMTWTPIPLLVIEQEVDRYIGMPGQALAYKTGQREIFRLREEAESRLGAKFDIAGFHDAVLTSGGLTLPVLADVVGDWISETAATP